MKLSTLNKRTKAAAAVSLSLLLLILIWHVMSIRMNIPIILPTPAETGAALVSTIMSPDFLVHVGTTVIRGLESFFLIFLISTVLGLLSGVFPIVGSLLTPVLVISKATPVMAIILLAFIWFTSNTVPIFSAFLMAFPVMFTTVENGVHQVSKELVEMSKVYRLSKYSRLRYLLIPSITPYIITGAKSSLSLIWKVVIAAEVLTSPSLGLGARMHSAQINLETAQVMSWTVIAIILTAISDILFALLLRFIAVTPSHKEERNDH